jgi:hypothetical protein
MAPRKPRAPRKPKTDVPPVVETESEPTTDGEPSFFDDIATIIREGKSAVGVVQQATREPPPDAAPTGLAQSVLGKSFGVIGTLIGGGVDVVSDAFAAQNRQLLQMMQERDQARADAKALLAFYESNAFVEPSVRDRVRLYPGAKK